MNIKAFINNAVLLLTSIILLLIFLSTFNQIDESSSFVGIKIIKLFLALSGILMLLRIVSIQKISSSIFLTGLITLSLIVRFWWIYTIDTQPISDFDYMLKSAQGLLDGDSKRIYNSHYFDIASDNIPFTLFEAAMLYFFKTITSLKIINVLLSTVIVYLLYKITQRVASENTARIVSLMAVLYPPFFIYTSILTNQTLSIVLILCAILGYIRKINMIYVGLLLALANLIRPTAVIYLVGIVVFIILNNFYYKQIWTFKGIKNLFAPCFKLVAAYFLLIFIVSISLETSGISKHSLFYNPIPNYKLLVGLNHETIGNYSKSDNQLTYDTATFERNAQTLIKERVEDKSKLLKLFNAKFNNLWGKFDAALSWALTKNVNNSNEVIFLKLFEQYFYLAIIGFGLCFLMSLLFGKKLLPNSYYLLFCTTLLGFVLIYLFIEIQTRYRYEIYPLFLFLAGAGITTLFSKLFPHQCADQKLISE